MRHRVSQRSLRLDTADGIITTLRRAGFPADVRDLLEYREPGRISDPGPKED